MLYDIFIRLYPTPRPLWHLWRHCFSLLQTWQTPLGMELLLWKLWISWRGPQDGSCLLMCFRSKPHHEMTGICPLAIFCPWILDCLKPSKHDAVDVGFLPLKGLFGSSPNSFNEVNEDGVLYGGHIWWEDAASGRRREGKGNGGHQSQWWWGRSQVIEPCMTSSAMKCTESVRAWYVFFVLYSVFIIFPDAFGASCETPVLSIHMNYALLVVELQYSLIMKLQPGFNELRFPEPAHVQSLAEFGGHRLDQVIPLEDDGNSSPHCPVRGNMCGSFSAAKGFSCAGVWGISQVIASHCKSFRSTSTPQDMSRPSKPSAI